jgi:hypothetical protein
MDVITIHKKHTANSSRTRGHVRPGYKHRSKTSLLNQHFLSRANTNKPGRETLIGG